MERNATPPVPARLGLWDAVSIIVGIIIGVGIFGTPGGIFAKAPSAWGVFLAWGAGGLLAMIGALCFAELASAYPRSGGEYVYLSRAYGPLVGYLFGWAQLTLIRPGSIGAMAFVCAEYCVNLRFVFAQANAAQAVDSEALTMVLAMAAVIVLTIVNILGVTIGKYTQNALSLIKVFGLLAIIVVGFWWGASRDFGALHGMNDASYNAALVAQLAAAPGEGHLGALGVIGAASETASAPGWFALVMIWILWTYAGWNEAAYIASEVRNSHRNIPLALILGTGCVMAIYMLINLAYFLALGPLIAHSKTPATDVLRLASPEFGGDAITVLVVLSALGAINGMIFTTARIYTEFGADHRLFSALSKWNRHWGTPVRALIIQGLITIALIFVIANGLWGQAMGKLATLLGAETSQLLGIGAWSENKDAFDQLLEVTAAVFWLFFLMTGISLMILRYKDPLTPRPFRVPLYPLLPLAFCGSCAYMLYGAIANVPDQSQLGIALLLIGLPFYFMPKKRRKSTAPKAEPVSV